MAVENEYDVGIMFSTDTDLKPALEYVAGRSGHQRAEVAAWSAKGQHNSRLSIKGSRRIYCHWVGEDVYDQVRDTTNYAR